MSVQKNVVCTMFEKLRETSYVFVSYQDCNYSSWYEPTCPVKPHVSDLIHKNTIIYNFVVLVCNIIARPQK